MQPGSLAFKRAFCIGFLSLAILNFAPLSRAVTVEAVPNPRQKNGSWVTDMANILSPTTEAEINRLISELEAKNGSEIAVVTVPETAPSASPKEFATTLFNRWKIGKKGQDNGVLLLISKGDRRVEIETGYGVEALLPDAKVGNIIQQEITPRFKQKNFDGGTLAGTKALVFVLRADAATLNLGAEQPSSDTNLPWLLLAGIGGGGVGLAAIAVYATSRRPIFVKPEGRSRTHSWWRRPLHCAICKQPMQELDSAAVLPHLRQPEQVAQQLGSVKFIGWRCPNTHPPLTGLGMHIRAYILDTSRFRECPTCQELTMEHSARILQYATQYSEGIRQITYSCHCCSYKWVTEETTPRLPPSPSSSTSMSDGSSSNSSWSSDSGYSSSTSTDSGSSSSSDSSYSTSTDSDSSSSSDSSYSTSTDSSSSWSSDSSSSSSSDFGGGSSGGGGAGGDW